MHGFEDSILLKIAPMSVSFFIKEETNVLKSEKVNKLCKTTRDIKFN